MEQYTWLEFIFFTVVILAVYYGIVYFKYYYPYLGNKSNPLVTKEINSDGKNMGIDSVDDIQEPEDNPFIKKFDIVEEKPTIEEKNINNSNISNNFNNFDNTEESANTIIEQKGDDSSSLNALNSVFSNLPVVNEAENINKPEVEPDIDLTDILPEVQELDFVEMNVTEYIPDEIETDKISKENYVELDTDLNSIEGSNESGNDIEEEVNAYIDPNAGQLNFSFGEETIDLKKINSQIETKTEKEPKKKEDSSSGDDTYFDFNN